MAELCKKIDFSELGFVVFNGDMSSSVESEEQLFADYVDYLGCVVRLRNADPPSTAATTRRGGV